MAVERRALVGDRLTVLRDRLLVSAEVGEHQSKVVQGPAQDALIMLRWLTRHDEVPGNERGTDRQRLLIDLDGFGQLARLVSRRAEVVVAIGQAELIFEDIRVGSDQAAPDRDGFPEHLARFGRPVRVDQQNAEFGRIPGQMFLVQRVVGVCRRQPGTDLDRLPVSPLGLFGLVRLDQRVAERGLGSQPSRPGTRSTSGCYPSASTKPRPRSGKLDRLGELCPSFARILTQSAVESQPSRAGTGDVRPIASTSVGRDSRAPFCTPQPPPRGCAVFPSLSPRWL